MSKLFLTSMLAALLSGVSFESRAAEVAVASLEGSNWQLLQMKVLGGYLFTAEDPGKYVLNFRSENRLTGQSDCNQVTGSWLQDGLALRFEPFNSGRRLCAPGSLHNNLTLILRDVIAHEIRDGHLFLTTTTEEVEMEFESRD